MLTRDRRVRHLRLTCRREEHARQARVRLEDALRTATLGDEARLIVVRRLDLGPMPLRASATEWSRRLERRFQELRSEMVSVEHSLARDAAAVYFANAAEPWLRLAENTARGQPAKEWFWEKAAPGWTPRLTSAETLGLAFRALMAQGALQALALVARLGRAGRVKALLDVLSVTDIAPALPGVADASVEADADTPRLDLRGRATPPRWLVSVLAALPVGDARALLAVAAARAESGCPPLPIAELARLAIAWRSEPSPPPVDSLRQVTPPKAADVTPSPLNGEWAGVRGEAVRKDHLSPRDAPGSDPTPALPVVWAARPFTAAGGLFFLVRLFELTGLPDLLRVRPDLAEAGLPWRLLRGALRLARPTEDDALCLLPEPCLPLPLGELWRPLLRAHHECRRLTTFSLRQLVRRPARVSLTDTHMDVFFRAGDADLRIRRAGLDVDPGWVPWLQRVVAFHFNRED
jgi:hypothetical protein